MHHRLILAGLAATGGLLTTAFLQAAVAVPTRRRQRHGADAFTIGSYTFDPFTVSPTGSPTSRASTLSLQLSSAPPLLEPSAAA